MKTCSFCSCLLMTGVALAADPVAEITEVVRNEATGVVLVRYALRESDAIVTFGGDALSDSGEWKTLPDSAFRRVTGDVNRLVPTGGERVLVWRPEREDVLPAANGFRARLTLWSPAQPPDWMSVEIGGGKETRYFVSADALPHAVADRYWKASRFLFRKVPAKGVVWSMRSISPGRRVRLTSDYYLGVFAYTKAQQQSVVGYDASDDSIAKGADVGFCPRNKAAYAYFRGNDPSGSAPAYPIAEGSNLFLIREKTGLAVDFPTEAEWEYACRAGCGEALYTGEEATAENVARLAWFNVGEAGGGKIHEVGLKRPNAWGFHDMLGNVAEWCLDYYADRSFFSDGVFENPTGPSSWQESYAGGRARVARGGCFWNGASELRQGANFRWGYDDDHYEDPAFGVRLRAPIPGSDAAKIENGTVTRPSLDTSARTDYWDCTGYENPSVVEATYDCVGTDFRLGTRMTSDGASVEGLLFDSGIGSVACSGGINLNSRPRMGGVAIIR